MLNSLGFKPQAIEKYIYARRGEKISHGCFTLHFSFNSGDISSPHFYTLPLCSTSSVLFVAL